MIARLRTCGASVEDVAALMDCHVDSVYRLSRTPLYTLAKAKMLDKLDDAFVRAAVAEKTAMLLEEVRRAKQSK